MKKSSEWLGGLFDPIMYFSLMLVYGLVLICVGAIGIEVTGSEGERVIVGDLIGMGIFFGAWGSLVLVVCISELIKDKKKKKEGERTCQT